MTSALPTAGGWDRVVRWALEHPVRSLLVVYVVSRVLALLAIATAAHLAQAPAGVGHLDPGTGDMFGLWDAQWYRRIAEQGYPVPLPADPVTGRLTYSAWAFFPAFPLLVRGLMLAGLPFTGAAVALNVALGAVGTVLVWKVLGHTAHASPQPERERLALVAACLWCFYPATGILLVPYSEALAVALVAAALLLLMRRRYWPLALVVPVLGYARPVAPALGVAVLVHLAVRWREERAAGGVPLRGSRAAAAVLLLVTGASAVAWPMTVGWLTGLPNAFFDVQAAWGQQPEKGPFVLWLSWAWEERGLFAVAVMVALVGTYIALVLGRHGRWLPIEVRGWALAYPLYLFAVVRPITSMWRFLLLDLPLAALVASVAMRTSSGGRVVPHWRRRVVVVVALLVVGMFWWTAALLTYTPWNASPP